MSVDVLIAEDELSILDSLDFILRRAGWNIESVTNGEDALDRVRQTRPRVVVLDVMLPRLSGFDVLKQLRADPATRTLPILILTARGRQQDRRIAEELGADAFVTKPYSNAEVVRAVAQLLGEDAGSA
ncbi:MAG: response regulator [Phyllobacteriaceae bacterium]|nr:response regulator [Phyllobacteriaceae bacterium]